MIEYRTLSKLDIDRLEADRTESEPAEGIPSEIPHSGVQAGASAIARLACHQALEPDAVRTIAAFDAGRMVGKLHIVYTDLLLEGRRLQRCAVGENFFVLDEYRDRGVGLSLMLKALRLGFPFIESGVSGQMRSILDSWKQFVLVDSSPMYQIALDRRGLLQTARWDFYAEPSRGGRMMEMATKASLLYRGWRHRRRLSTRERLGLTPLPASAENGMLDRCLSTPRAAVQLPWSRALLARALSGADPAMRAWLVEYNREPSRPRLVSLYRQDRVLRRDAEGNDTTIGEAHLNEIYPPLEESAPIAPVLDFAARRAKQMGASILHVHAMTPSLRAFCEGEGLRSRMAKSIYIAAGGVDPATRGLLSEPSNWWCRAFNENQFEEILIPRREGSATPSPLV